MPNDDAFKYSDYYCGLTTNYNAAADQTTFTFQYKEGPSKQPLEINATASGRIDSGRPRDFLEILEKAAAAIRSNLAPL